MDGPIADPGFVRADERLCTRGTFGVDGEHGGAADLHLRARFCVDTLQGIAPMWTRRVSTSVPTGTRLTSTMPTT